METETTISQLKKQILYLRITLAVLAALVVVEAAVLIPVPRHISAATPAVTPLNSYNMETIAVSSFPGNLKALPEVCDTIDCGSQIPMQVAGGNLIYLDTSNLPFIPAEIGFGTEKPESALWYRQPDDLPGIWWKQ